MPQFESPDGHPPEPLPVQPGGAACPSCTEPLVLLVEPGVAEFYCPSGHDVSIEKLLKEQPAGAQKSLREALSYWETRHEETQRLSGEDRAAGQEAAVALWERRLLAIAERLRTIHQALAKRA